MSLRPLRTHPKTFSLIALGLIDLAFFSSTNAAKVPAAFLMAGFILMALSLGVIIYGILKAACYYGWPARRLKVKTFYLSGLIIGLIALQSAGQLSVRDLSIILPLVLLAYIYTSYQKRVKI